MIPAWVTSYTIHRADRIFDEEDDSIRRAFLREFPWGSDDGVFLFQAFGADRWPSQGWKLHVSATPETSVSVLQSVAPALRRAGVRFKVVSSRFRLLEFNSGLHGLSQVGKFMTVYPSSDDQAVELARSLDQLTREMNGPVIPSDRPLHPGSLVHYRYGAFRDPDGSTASAANMIFDEAERLVPDQRQPWYLSARNDPFQGPREDDGANDRKPLLGRFLVHDALSRSAWGRVYDVIDLQGLPPVRRILKEYWHDVSPDVYGRDSRQHAALEASILGCLPAQIRAPQLVDWIESDGNVYLVLEHVSGWQLADEERRPSLVASGEATLDLAIAIARTVASINDQGIIHRDIKPSNLIVSPSGHVAPVDFAFAYRLGVDDGPPIGYGTPGFVDPAVSMTAPPTVSTDVFGWGATMHWLVTGSPPTTDGTARTSVRTIRDDLPTTFSGLVDRSVDLDRAKRPPSLHEIIDELRLARTVSRPPSRVADGPGPEAPAPDWASEAERLGQTLLAVAEPRGPGLAWPAPGKPGDPVYVANMYSGAAGIGIVLSRLAHRFDSYRAATEGVLRWLGSGEFGHGSGQIGLYTGDSGVGLLYLMAARDLDVPAYVDMAVLRSRRLDGAPADEVDLVEGSAGRLFFLAQLANTTCEEADRRRVLDAAARLRPWVDRVVAVLDQRSPVPYAWRLPQSMRYLGLLHGVAGVGMSLLAAGTAARADEIVQASIRLGDVLVRFAETDANSYGETYAWPRRFGDERVTAPALCHGATGIGLFLLRLWLTTGEDRFREAAIGAAREAAGAKKKGVSLCHGVSGDVDFLLSAYQATHDAWLLDAARSLAVGRLLPAAFPRGPMSADKPPVDYSLMLGMAGLTATFDRLANAEVLPDLVFA